MTIDPDTRTAVEAVVYDFHDAVTAADTERLDVLCADGFDVTYLGEYAFDGSMPKEVFLQMTPALFSRMSSVTHFITNLRIDRGDGTVTARYLMYAVHMFAGDGFDERADSGGRMELDLVEVDGDWRISAQRVHGGFRDARYQGLLMGELQPRQAD